MRPEAAGSAGRAGEAHPTGGHRVQVRWRDLDGLGHVNHTVVLTYLEEGRDAWLEAHGIRRDEYVVGRCSVDFRREIDPAFRAVTVQCGVRELGRSSLTTSEQQSFYLLTSQRAICTSVRACCLQAICVVMASMSARL